MHEIRAVSRYWKLRTTFSCTHRDTQICQLHLPYLIELMQKCVLSLDSLSYWPQYCFQNLLLNHQRWMIVQNNIITSPPWYRQWLCVLQNPNSSIQEEAELRELLKATLGGKPVKASRNTNGPPKRSYQPEDWREVYSLFPTTLAKFN